MTTRSRIAVALVAALVVVGTVVAGGAVGAQSDTGSAQTNGTTAPNTTTTTSTATATPATSGLPPADDIYVEENGDAVLAYEEESNGTQATYGLNVSEGLFHALVATDLEGSSGVVGNATAVLTRDRSAANGTFSMPRPESLADLSVNVTGEQTSENARYDAAASGTVEGTNSSIATLVRSARTSGNVTTTGSTFDADVEAHAQLLSALGQPQHQEFHLAEQNGSYTLDAAQNQTVPAAATSRWDSRERAEQTLRTRYASIATSLNGTANLTLESYSFTNATDSARVDVEYTITYDDIERGVADQLTRTLTTAENVDLDRSEARNVTQRLTQFEIDDLSVQYDQANGSIDATMQADLRNYDDAVLAGLDVAEALDTQSLNGATVGGMAATNATTTGMMGMNETAFDAQIEQARDRFEARQAANLTSHVSFDANVTSETPDTLGFGLESHYRTENWGQYVEELQNRGIESSDMQYELHAATEDERVNVSAAVEVSGDDLLQRAAERMLTSTGGATGNAQQYVTAFREAGFQKARTDVSVQDGQVRVEAGAAFENASAIRDALAATGQSGAIESIVGRTDDDTVTTYVRVDGAVSADATESQVRELGYVDDETTVHMPGSWDRTFPKTDTVSASEYLGLAGTNASAPSETDDGDAVTSTPTETDDGDAVTSTPTETSENTTAESDANGKAKSGSGMQAPSGGNGKAKSGSGTPADGQ